MSLRRPLTLLAALLSASPVFAQAAPAPATNGATAPAEVVIVRPLSLVKVQDLDFGTVVSGPLGGTITIAAGGDQPDPAPRSTTGDVVAAGGSPHAATFYTYGGPRQNLFVRRREAVIQLARVGGGGTPMTITGLRLNGPVDRYLSSEGFLELRVGGTLAVGPNQASGAYRGTFTLVATYL